MRIVGTIESDLVGATEYQEGGIGPFFGSMRIQEALSVEELLYRFVRALERVEPVRVLSLYLDDAEVFRDIEGEGGDEGTKPKGALDIGHEALSQMEEEPAYVGLTVAHEDKQFYHVIFIEATTDHEVDEAPLSVLDTAEVLEDAEPLGGAETETIADDKPASDAEPDIAPEDIEFDDEPDIAQEDSAGYEDALFAFLEKLQAHLAKELQLSEPEIDVWTDYTGEYELQQALQPPPLAPGMEGGALGGGIG